MDVLKIINYNWLINLGLIEFDESYKNISSESKKILWLPDNLSQNCFQCQAKFSLLLNRQHHCRICGNIFCGNCTSKQIQFVIKDKNNNEKLIKIKVCNYCFKICISFDNYIGNNTIKNLNKYHYFCKYIEISQKNNEKFLEIENCQKENEIKKNIDNTYDIIIQNLVRNILKEYFDDDIVIEWKNVIYKIIIEVINNLRNSYLFLDDKLDINKYIKIKQIEYKDNSLSEVIPGIVIKNNQIKNHEKKIFKNPKLLLINIDNNSLVKKLNNFSNSFKRINGYMNIIFQKIILNNPDVILIGKNYPKIFYNELTNESSMKNKLIFFDIKKKHLEQISRTTCNIIIPSLNLIGSKNPFGKCQKFYIKDLKNYSLLVFEGNSPMLFNSIILSGKNKLILKKNKMILKNLLIPSARDLYLQKYIIYAFNMNVNNTNDTNIINNILENNKKYRPDQINEKSLYSSYELTMNKFRNNFRNNLNITRNKSYEKRENLIKIKQGQIIQNKNKLNNIKEISIPSSFYNGFDLSLICKKKEYMNYSLLKFTKILSEVKNNNTIVNDTNTNQIIDEENSLDEKEIQKQYKICKTNSKKIFFCFFSGKKNLDQSIFQFFYDFFKNSKTTCKNCNELLNKHLYQYYRIDSKFIIKFIKDKEYDLDKVMTFIEKKGYFKSENLDLLFNIYTYGYCNICKNIVTPLFRFSNEILNYSTAKLFKLLSENLNMKNNNREYNFNIKEIVSQKENICEHLINKAISRILITEHGSCVFEYNKLTKYFIDPININVETESNSTIDISNNLKLNNAIYNLYNNENFFLIEKISTEALNNIKVVLEIMNELFQEQIKISQNLINKEKLDLFNMSITSLINIDILTIRLIDNFKGKMFKYLSKEYLQENDKDLYILKYIIYIKKIYAKIIQIKYIANIIEKYINKLNIISDILYSKIPYSYDENVKKPNLIEMPIVMQKLENKKEYLNIISFIENYDFRHNELDIENIKDDLSNIIANVLSSDDYINFIDNNDNLVEDNFKFTQIKCKRINNTNLNEDEIKINIMNKKNNISYLDIHELFENSLKAFDINNNIINNTKNNNINTKILENSSLLFNLEKNKFSLKEENSKENKTYNETESENKKIISFLKRELLSQNKEEFNFTIINDISNLLKNFNIKNNSSSFISVGKSPKKSINENNNDNIDNYFKNEDDEDSEKEEKKENSSESKSITINIFESITQDINEINDEMLNIKTKLDEFDRAFIDNQRQLNTLIKNSISENKNNGNLSRDSSNKNLFNIFNRSRKNSKSSNDSNDSKNSKHSKKSNLSERNNRLSFDVEYKDYGSRSFKLDSNSLSKLNDYENSDTNFLPKFKYIPEFLKIFDLKKINFLEDKLISQKYPEYEIKVFYPRQFQALRTIYFSENFENFIFSARQSEDWEISGGKSKANFFRTFDEKFAIKNISELEFNMLLDSAFNYFQHLSKFFFEKKPSLLAKILGAFHIKVKSPKEKEKNYYLIYMENIYYNKISKNNFDNFNGGESNLKVYDLKGSEINRYIRPKNKKNGKILLDTNFIEDNKGEPLFLDFDNFKILNQALINDCLFLKKESIIDYSLLIIYEINNDKENKNEFEIKKIRMGIIDYLRKYTWDKQIESYGKKLIHGFANPTIINPENYSERFKEKIKIYFSSV